MRASFLQITNREIMKIPINALTQIGHLLKKFERDERGATAVEYGLFVAAIAAVIVAIVITLGNKINTALTALSNAFP